MWLCGKYLEYASNMAAKYDESDEIWLTSSCNAGASPCQKASSGISRQASYTAAQAHLPCPIPEALPGRYCVAERITRASPALSR